MNSRVTRRPHSAGILLFRSGPPLEVLLVRPGGPFWRGKDQGAWMIPKGMIEPGESPVEAALREFAEELGTPLTTLPFPLCVVRQAGGKVVEAFAAEGDFDTAALASLSFAMEWPPRSGKMQHFPEVEEARWFPLAEARSAMLASQRPMLDALAAKLGEPEQ